MVVINIERQHAMPMALLHVRTLSTHSSHRCSAICIAGAHPSFQPYLAWFAHIAAWLDYVYDPCCFVTLYLIVRTVLLLTHRTMRYAARRGIVRVFRPRAIKHVHCSA